MPWLLIPLVYALGLWMLEMSWFDWLQLQLGFFVASALAEHFIISYGQMPSWKDSLTKAGWWLVLGMMVVVFVGAFY